MDNLTLLVMFLAVCSTTSYYWYPPYYRSRGSRSRSRRRMRCHKKPDPGIRCSVKTTNGDCCVFPFLYENVTYHSCTTVDNSDILWCATTKNYDKDEKYGDCNISQETSCTVKTASGDCCVFPFHYKNGCYESCTKTNNSNALWCATTTNYNDGKWGYCNLTQVVPSVPQNVTVVVKGNSLNVSWLPPNIQNGQIDYYIISLKTIDTNRILQQTNVTSCSFFTKILNERTHVVYFKIQAVNHAGIGEAAYSNTVVFMRLNGATTSILSTSILPTSILSNSIASTSSQSTSVPTLYLAKQLYGRKESKTDVVAVACGVTGSVLLFVLAVSAFCLLRKRIRSKQRAKSVKEFQLSYKRHLNSKFIPKFEVQKLVPMNARIAESVPENLTYITFLENWELSPNNLKLLDRKLGEGQFGIVRQGLLTTGNGASEVVAVKMLKDNAGESDLSDLLSELNILKEVNKDPHANVIKFIGGCSLEGKLLLVTEFCPGGSLRKFLIKSRASHNYLDSTGNYANLTSTLSHRQLLKMAMEVASGMAHLSAQKFVHRDLAARNILIGEDIVAKISDFGLARDVGDAEEYIRSNQNLLPVKWMALESLLNGRFTTASDVWSFGILIYEISTLGEEPYKSISPYNIVNHVGSGCRMSKPSHCSAEVYEIMTNCWKVKPDERPTFSQIRELFHDMLSDIKKSYINVHQVEDEALLTTIEPSHNSRSSSCQTTYA